MRDLILIGCGVVAAGLSGTTFAAGETYTNKQYCFSALHPAEMSIWTVNQGAQFNFGKRCDRVGELGCDFIFAYAMYFFEDIDLLADASEVYESKGWVLKPDEGFGRVKGWSQQTLFKGSGDQQTEVHIYARPLRRSELVARDGVVLAVGYRVIAEFNSSERKTFSTQVSEVLKSWRMLEGCDPFKPSALETPGGGS